MKWYRAKQRPSAATVEVTGKWGTAAQEEEGVVAVRSAQLCACLWLQRLQIPDSSFVNRQVTQLQK
jgi:hypothetical protein